MSNVTSNKTSMGDESNFKPVYDSFLAILAFCIVAINIFVVSLFVRKDYLRTKTNSFLVSLAFSDLITGLLLIPLYLTCSFTLENGVCIASAAFYRAIAASTMAHILVATLERYVAIMYAMRYYHMVTTRRVCVVIGLVWVFSIVYSVIQLFWLNIDGHNINKMGDKTRKYERPYNLTGVIVFFTIPLFVMIFCLARLFIVIRRQVETIRKQTILAADPRKRSIATDKRALLIFTTMLTIFVICWLSWYLTLFQVELGEGAILPEVVADVLDFFRFGTSLINPLLYTMWKKDFRRAICADFARCCGHSALFKPRRDSGVLTMSTDINARHSLSLLNGQSPAHKTVNDTSYKDCKEPEIAELVTHD